MPIVLKSGSLNLLEPSEPIQACNGIALPFTISTVSFNVKKCYVLPIKFIDVFGTVLRNKKQETISLYNN